MRKPLQGSRAGSLRTGIQPCIPQHRHLSTSQVWHMNVQNCSETGETIHLLRNKSFEGSLDFLERLQVREEYDP